jgi:hypothetical protein
MLAVVPIILGVQLLLQAAGLDIQGIPKEPLHAELAPELKLREASDDADRVAATEAGDEDEEFTTRRAA